jgi:hypothetical protein
MAIYTLPREHRVTCDSTGCDRQVYLRSATPEHAVERVIGSYGWARRDDGTLRCWGCKEVDDG